MIVQDLFKECDVGLLLDNLVLISEACKEYLEEIGREKYLKILKYTINDMLKIEPVISEDFIYVSRCEDWEDSYLSPSIVHKEDLLKYTELIKELHQEFKLEKNEYEKSPTSYGLMFVPRKELLGYQFSEFSIEKYGLYEVIASVFHELTYFGYDNETCDTRVKEESDELARRAEDVMTHPEKLVPFNEAMDELFGEDWKDIEVEMPSEEEIEQSMINNGIITYEHYYKILEKLNLV